MKKILFVLFSAALLLSCSQSSNQKGQGEDIDQVPHETTGLTLNNGAKWKADTMTNRHLVRLKTIANMFKVDPRPSIEQYHILGSDLQKGLDSMVQDCTLKGAPDEALHEWMHPILRQIRELKNVQNSAIAQPVFDSLDQRLNLYYDYFE